MVTSAVYSLLSSIPRFPGEGDASDRATLALARERMTVRLYAEVQGILAVVVNIGRGEPGTESIFVR